jgi:hypothetical protein
MFIDEWRAEREANPAQKSYLSECETPVTAEPSHISEPTTPLEEKREDIDMDQLTLRLYIHLALKGNTGFPAWQGLATALQSYFEEGWQKDRYTVEECEKHKWFLFWNAVAD